MTFTKTGAEFPDDCANIGLSDAAYRTHHEGISWLFTVERTDCLIPKHLVRRFVGSCNAAVAIGELLAVGFWADRGECWEVVHHADVIRSGIVAQQNRRAQNKRTQAAWRARRKSRGEDTDISADVRPYADRQTVRQTEEPADEKQSQEEENNNLRVFSRERGGR